MEKQILLASDVNYTNYRIPGIAVTGKGTVLAYFEARRAADDWARMDILLYRSEDGGKTFGAPIVLAAGTDAYPTVNNPVCIVSGSGILHFLYCRNYTLRGGDIFCRHSADDGKTWSEPENIMAATKPELHNVFATGPCHGICTSAGMLAVPVWMVLKSAGMEETSHHPAVVSTLWSRDDGKTWHLGDIIPPTEECPDPNETQAAELPDGRIYMNVRSHRAGCRAVTVSETGIGGWTKLCPDRALPDPACSAGLCSGEYRDAQGICHPVLLFTNCADRTKRANLICRASVDGGQTWSRSLCIEPQGAGYSDIAVLPDGTVCVLYEQDAGKKEILARFHLRELMEP